MLTNKLRNSTIYSDLINLRSQVISYADLCSEYNTKADTLPGKPEFRSFVMNMVSDTLSAIQKESLISTRDLYASSVSEYVMPDYAGYIPDDSDTAGTVSDKLQKIYTYLPILEAYISELGKHINLMEWGKGFLKSFEKAFEAFILDEFHLECYFKNQAERKRFYATQISDIKTTIDFLKMLQSDFMEWQQMFETQRKSFIKVDSAIRLWSRVKQVDLGVNLYGNGSTKTHSELDTKNSGLDVEPA